MLEYLWDDRGERKTALLTAQQQIHLKRIQANHAVKRWQKSDPIPFPPQFPSESDSILNLNLNDYAEEPRSMVLYDVGGGVGGGALIIKILQFWMSWQMQSGRCSCCCPGGSTPQQCGIGTHQQLTIPGFSVTAVLCLFAYECFAHGRRNCSLQKSDRTRPSRAHSWVDTGHQWHVRVRFPFPFHSHSKHNSNA